MRMSCPFDIPPSLGLTPIYNMSHWNKRSHIVTIKNGQDLNLVSQREREVKLEHFVHSPMTRSTKDQHTQRVLSCQPDAYLQTRLKCFQCPPLSALARPSPPLTFDVQSSDNMTV